MRYKEKYNTVDNPLVSIIVPTYNQSSYLAACLDSIMLQSYPEIEIIVVNDCSEDTTDEVIRNYLDNLDDSISIVTGFKEGSPVREELKRYPGAGRKIVYHKNSRNIGATGTYNKGFSMAKGSFATFVPSDDILLPGHLTRMVSALNDEYDFVYSDFHLIDDEYHIKADYSLPDYDFTRCLADWYRLGPSHLFRLALFREHQGFDPDYTLANDYDLFLRFAMGGAGFLHIPEVLYNKRSHENRRHGQWEKEKYELMIKESVQCAKRAGEWMKEKMKTREVRQAL